MRYTVLWFIRAPFYESLIFVAMCSVVWLFWLSYQYLPSDWLERLLWRILIVARGSFPESPGRRVRMIFFVYCIASLFYYVFVLSPAPTWYIFLLLWRDIAYLCWKCRKIPSKQTSYCQTTPSEISLQWFELKLLVRRQEGHPACTKCWVFLCWRFDWSFARLIAPVVTTTSTIPSDFSKIQNGDILGTG